MLDTSTATPVTTPAPTPSGEPILERHRHELRRRVLTVSAVERLTPNMLRLTLTGPDMADFISLSPGDHVKIFVPDGTGGEAMRDYTPRRYDTARQELVLDFALHEAGPATAWALSVKVGDEARIGGPRGSLVISGPIRHWLLIGDETALPSIGRRIEEMAAGVTVTSLVAVPSAADEQPLETAADHTALWIHRGDPTDPAPFLERLNAMHLPEATFVWIAAEAGVARAVRDHFLISRAHPTAWLRAAGYWVAGEPDGQAKDL